MAIFQRVTARELKRIRVRLRVTQTKLAERLGVTQNTVARWEIGLRGIPEPTARLIRRLMEEKTLRQPKR